jgi:predicted SprT family Zn-dependent metalloprotease
MEASLAQHLAHSLLLDHHLPDWSFAFNRRRRSLGLCRYVQKRIELSLPYVLRNDEASIRDTILHEIAHALAGQKAGHGPQWKAVCRRIGAIPERCDTTAAMPRGRWHARCAGCGQEFQRHRRPARHATYNCRHCGPEKGAICFYLILTQAAWGFSWFPLSWASGENGGVATGFYRIPDKWIESFEHRTHNARNSIVNHIIIFS